MSTAISAEQWVRTFQTHLLAETLGHIPTLSPAVREAFMATPRHHFVPSYRTLGDAGFRPVDESNLLEHLPAIYRNSPLGIFGRDTASTVTISMPSLVLKMLDLLELSPGMRVFELGTGSGWNTALLSNLVGPSGYVESIEIIPELAARAAGTLRQLGLDNVNVIAGDGGTGPATEGTFDRAVFTAGSYDIPHRLHQQVAIGGLLLFVLKCPGGGDVLILLKREQDHFRSVSSMPVLFVPVTGPTRDASLDPEPLERFAPWQELASQRLKSRPLRCGVGSGGFSAGTFSLRSFLSIVEPSVRYFLDGRDRDPKALPSAGCTAFGLWNEAARSLALARGVEITTYGNPESGELMDRLLSQWLELGMPSAVGLDVRAYPSTHAPEPRPGEWVVARRDTHFVWSAPPPPSS